MSSHSHVISGAGAQEFAIVCSYTDLEVMAHRPLGHPGEGLSIFSFCPERGMCTLVNQVTNIVNPSFVRVHPTSNIFYVVTESIKEENELVKKNIYLFA